MSYLFILILGLPVFVKLLIHLSTLSALQPIRWYTQLPVWVFLDDQYIFYHLNCTLRMEKDIVIKYVHPALKIGMENIREVWLLHPAC